MSDTTKIEWADATFNPWIGCRKVSPGCENCYMFARQHRFGKKGTDRIRTTAATWRNPVKWNRGGWICSECGGEVDLSGDCECGQAAATGKFHRRRVFLSLCDWLDPEVPLDWLSDFLALTVRSCGELTWLLLTKRPELFCERMRGVAQLDDLGGQIANQWISGKVPPNLWIGTSVEDQTRADERIPALLQIPATLRFLSVEPLLGPVDLWSARYQSPSGGQNGAVSCWKPSVDWVIVGGESGPKARPCNVEWIRSIRDECHAASVPLFVKQAGSNAWADSDPMTTPHVSYTVSPFDKTKCAVRLKFSHPKGGEMSEWPEDLRVRQLPAIS
jgi:protein gp37